MSSKRLVSGFKFRPVRSSEFGVRLPVLVEKNSKGIVRILCFLFSVSLSVSLFSACGRKTPVRPPELVAPEPINDLVLEIEKNGVKLQWGRTDKTVDGS